MSYTPGPWKWFETEDGQARVNPVDGGLVIAECRTRNPFDPEQQANARLISAAPDLLKALKMVMRSFHPQTHHDVDDYNAARAAIAKATGETQ